MGETFVKAQTSMTFRQILIFYEFSRPGFYFFVFNGFPWFCMTVGTLFDISDKKGQVKYEFNDFLPPPPPPQSACPEK